MKIEKYIKYLHCIYSLRREKHNIKIEDLMKEKRNEVLRISKGYNSQGRFDEVISDLDVSSIRFLRQKYTKEIQDFQNHFDLNNLDYQRQYKMVLQRKKMLDEEYEFRKISELEKEDEWFDSESGIVYDKNKKEIYSIAFTEDEDDLVYVNLNARASSECRCEDDETDYDFYEPVDKKEKYAKWDYMRLVEAKEE